VFGPRSKLHHGFAPDDSFRRIDCQDGNGCASNGGQANELRAAPFEMAVPAVSARIEKAGCAVGQRIDSGEIGAFVKIAITAAQRQVAFNGRAAMLARSNMIYQVRKIREGFRHVAILAAMGSAGTNGIAE
jgi:hypothetical protein